MSCTNSRASDLAAAARVFKEASPAKIPDSVKFYIAAASLPEQKAAEEVSGTCLCIMFPSDPRDLSRDYSAYILTPLPVLVLTEKC